MIPQRCKSNPREAQFVHFYPPSDTALHRILRTSTASLDVDSTIKNHIQQIKLNAVSALLATYPTATSIRDTFRRTPLHIACMEIHGVGGCAEAAIMILDAYPKASAVQDLEGRTPLHYLLGRNDVIPLDLLSKLLAVFPKALMMQDNVKETPFMTVQQRGTEIQNADAVLEMLQTAEEGHRGQGTTTENHSDDDETNPSSTCDRSNGSLDGSCAREQRPKEGNPRARTV